MKHHHFNIAIRRLDVIETTCMDPEYDGPDNEYFRVTYDNEEFDPEIFDDCNVIVSQIQFSLPSLFDRSHPVFERCREHGLDPSMVAETCLELAKHENEIQEINANAGRENEATAPAADVVDLVGGSKSRRSKPTFH